jgi:hypothetical protein
MESTNKELAPYIATPGKTTLKAVSQTLRWTFSEDTSNEEDSRQDVRVRFEAEDSSRDNVNGQLPSSPDQLPQKNYIRESSPCPSIPRLDHSSSEGSDRLSLSLRRCHAWSQDSLDRHRSQESATIVRVYGRRDSMLIDSKYGSYESLEDSPTYTWVYWEEQLDASSDFRIGEP